VQQFANIYEYSVDFQRDIQPGDNFEMFFVCFIPLLARAESNQNIGSILTPKAGKIITTPKEKRPNVNSAQRPLMVRDYRLLSANDAIQY